MKKILASLLLFTTLTAHAGSPFIFKGSVAKNLASGGIEVSNSSTKQILDLNVDPRVGPGVAATAGSIGMGVGQIFYKYGAGNTDWYIISGTEGTPNTFAGYSTAGQLGPIPGWTTSDVLGAKNSLSFQNMVAASDPGAVSVKSHTFEIDLDAQAQSTGTSYQNMVLDAHYDRPNSGSNLTGNWQNLNINTTHEGSGTVAGMTAIQASVSNTSGGSITDINGIQSIINGNSVNSTNGFESRLNGNSANLTAGSFYIDGDSSNNAIAINAGFNPSSSNTNGFTIFNGYYSGSTSGNGTLMSLSNGPNTITGDLNGLSINNNGGTDDWSAVNIGVNGNTTGNTTQINSYDNGNTTGSFTGLQISKDGSAANLLGANFSFQNDADAANSTLFNGSDDGDNTANKQGVSVQVGGTAADVTGLNANITGTYSNSVTGLNIDVNSATNNGNPIGRKSVANLNGGTISSSYQTRTVSNSPAFVDFGNVFSGELQVLSGTPITGTDYIHNNLAGGINAADDFGTSAFGLGFATVGYVAQHSVLSGVTVDKLSMAIAGFNYPPSSTGGTITDAAMYRTIAPLSAGGSINLTNLYAFKAENTLGDFSSSATNAYGIYLDDDGFKNYLGGITRIGGTSYVAPTEALDVTGNGRFSLGIKLEDPGAGTDAITIQAPTLAAPYTLTLPVDDGSSGEVLSTNGSGVLSWSSAVSSPLTTKGDLYTFDTGNARLAVGTNNHVLMADSATGTGLKYAQIIDANIDAAAAIARTKIASGTANHVLINDGTGVMSSEASLDETRGGTGQTTYATGDVLYATGADTLGKLTAGTNGNVLTLAAGVPTWAAPGGGGSAWSVFATITGADDSLLGSFSTDTPVENSSYTLANNVGASLSAEISCSSTNASTGTTCSTGDEQLGIAFTPTTTGYAEVCVNFSYYSDNENNAITSRQFKLNKTANNSQTPTTSGTNIKPTYLSGVGGRSASSLYVEVCDVFSVTASTKETFRLVYRGTSGGGSGTNAEIIYGSTSFQGWTGSENGRINFKARPL